MADWFETRFREPVDPARLDPAFVARVRALVVEEWHTDSGTTASADTDVDPTEGDIIMLDIEDRPTGRRSVKPGRRSSGRWLLVAAAAAVVVVVSGVLVVAGGDDEHQVDTATPPPTTAPTPASVPARDITHLPIFAPLLPGRDYVIDPDDDDATPLRVTYQIPTEGWESWLGAVKPIPEVDGFTVLSITAVPNVVTDGCRDHTPRVPPVGPTVDDLATALSQLAPFEVTAPPTDVTLFGYPGKHLELTVPDLRLNAAEIGHNFADCLDGELHSWISPLNDGSFYGYDGPGQTEEFWILDVEGTRLVLVKSDSSASPAQDVTERDAIFDSIRIEP